jgi:serine/threonine protein kinase
MMGRAEAANVEGEQARPKSSLKLGKYQLLAVLGRGGMAEVFLALSRGAMGFDKLAVIKRLREGLADDENFRTMFLDEARLAARLNHPNVVHTYEVGEHEGVYFIAMEYLEGQSLNKVVREAEKRGTPLAPVVSARIISDALAGLHHAHTLTDFDGRPLDIIHRDISPHNLFVTYEGTTKVVDFGIAKAAMSSTETEVGVLKGKVAYMSPEQATGAPIDARSDVFAMGIVLWELLTQRRLMTGDSAASTLHRLLNAPVPSASSLRHDVAPTLDAIVECALQKDPNRRFASALAMREAIEHFIASTGHPVRTEEIGRQVGAMFVDVREAIKRQIQEHVEGAGQVSAPPEDSQIRSGTRPREGTMVSGELPLLNVGGGSGSGVISHSNARIPAPAVSMADPNAGQGAGQSWEGAVTARPAQSGGTLAAGFAPPVGPASAAQPSASPPARGMGRVAIGILFGVVVLIAIGASVGTQLYLGHRSSPAPDDPASSVTPFNTPTQPSAHGTAAPTPPPSAAAAAGTPPASTASASGGSAATASGGSSSKGSHSHHGSAPPPATAAPPSDGVGYVTFDTYPWTRVTEGGQPLGTTPLIHISLPAGMHTFTLDNPEKGIHQTYAITVKAGESMTKRLGLQ